MRIRATFWGALAGLLALGAMPGFGQAKGKAPTPVLVRPAGTPEARYRAAKLLLDQGQNAAALAAFEPLAAPAARFARAADAAYLGAVAAARLKQWPDAEQLLNLLRTEYPTYPNRPDALLLQGQALFEQGDFDTALKTLALLPPEALAAEREAQKAAYLPRLGDRATWQRLLRRYPADAVLARTYAERLGPGGLGTDADQAQLTELVTKFSLDPARYVLRVRPGVKKASYNVAVLLPFALDDPSWETKRKNQFVTDLYAGLRLAQDSLGASGHTLQLFAYDTGADTVQLKRVLALPELAGMDLLVGPIYKAEARLLARYARDHQIVCVNPLSQDGDLVLDNPYHYLFGPSAATQGRAAAQFAASAFGISKPGILLYEDSKDDTDFANAYQATYEALGGKISVSRRFNPDVETSLSTAFQSLDQANASHLTVVSDNRRAAPAAFLARRYEPPMPPPAPGTKPPLPGRAATARLPLLGPAAWLDSPRLDVDQLGESATYFVQPKFLDEQADGYRRFRRQYLAKQHLPPSLFASQGFELLWFFGNALHQYGTGFANNLATAGASGGVIFQGQHYPAGNRDNQVVPVTKLDNLELQVVK